MGRAVVSSLPAALLARGGSRAGEAPAWRFSPEEVAGERRRRGFVSLEALVAFLRVELMEEPAGGGTEIGD